MLSKNFGDKTAQVSPITVPLLFFLEDRPRDSSLWAVARETKGAGFSTKKYLMMLTFLSLCVMSPAAA